MYHSICPAHTARSRCFVPAFHQSPRRHKELFGLGLRRIQWCDRFGVLAVLHCRARFPNRHGGFPRIDSRSVEASSAPTRRGAACTRGCRLKAGTPLVLLASSVQWRRGEFEKTLGDRSRRRLTDLSAQLHPRERLPAFRFNERVRPKGVRTPDQRTLRAGRDTRHARERSARLPCPEWSTFTFA
jgi:hypothetical protein